MIGKDEMRSASKERMGVASYVCRLWNVRPAYVCGYDPHIFYTIYGIIAACLKLLYYNHLHMRSNACIKSMQPWVSCYFTKHV